MKIGSLVVLLLLAASAAVGQQMPVEAEQTKEVLTTVVVPVVGTVVGANGVRWKTDLLLNNDQRTEATVAIEMPAAADQPFIILTLAPGEVQRFTDVVAQAFGIDAALSPLIVTTNNRRSVLIGATVYGLRTDGEFTDPQPIAVQYGPSYYPLRVLHGLSFSDDYRTNIGLANLSDQPAEFVLALQRLQGRNLAVTNVIVPPHKLWHMPVQSLFPLITKGDDFSVLIETPTPDTICYASVIENATSRAKFVQSTIGTR